MKITFDPAKRAATLANRDLDFVEAAEVFAGPTFTMKDTRFEYDEDRFQTYGLLRGRLIMVVWTPRGSDRHVISMRKCNDREKAEFTSRLARP